MLRKIAGSIKRQLVDSEEDRVYKSIDALHTQCKSHFKLNPEHKLKILWITNFNLEPRRFAHDAALISSLRMRGAEIIPVVCGQAQTDQCIINLGKWENFDQKHYAKQRAAFCKNCAAKDYKFWRKLELEPENINDFISDEDKQEINNTVKAILKLGWRHYRTEDGFPLGEHVFKAVMNGEMQGRISPDWLEDADRLAQKHIYNILILLTGYKKIFLKHDIDRVFGNGGYYYHWDVPRHIANQKDISYYRAYPIGIRVFTWNYHKNNNELVDLSASWKTWKNKALTEDMTQAVEDHLKYRGLLGQPKSFDLLNKTSFTQEKPIILIMTGVIWDANTLHPGAVYSNMYDWLIDTLEFLREKKELQVIVRVHPADRVATNVTGSRDNTFWGEMQKRNFQPPSHVHIIWEDEQVETYELMRIASLGICYSSTTGLEFCCLGKPMIVLGKPHYSAKGFTFEPTSKQEYFDMLMDYENLDREPIKQQAYKYWYFYAFHASVDLKFLEPLGEPNSWVKRGMSDFDSRLRVKDAQALLPGKNQYLDYLCDSITYDLDIFSETRWPPLCLDYA